MKYKLYITNFSYENTVSFEFCLKSYSWLYLIHDAVINHLNLAQRKIFPNYDMTLTYKSVLKNYLACLHIDFNHIWPSYAHKTRKCKWNN
jgi:hypothetical protein